MPGLVRWYFYKYFLKETPKFLGRITLELFPPPNLIKILRVLVGNSAGIGNVIDVNSGAPAVGFKAEDGVRYVIVALTQFIRRKPACELIIRLAHIIVLKPQIATGTEQVKAREIDVG